MAFVIKDIKRNEYFRQRCADRWYSSDINTARLYTSKDMAQRTINADEHHVSYPGDRELKIVEIALIEV